MDWLNGFLKRNSAIACESQK